MYLGYVSVGSAQGSQGLRYVAREPVDMPLSNLPPIPMNVRLQRSGQVATVGWQSVDADLMAVSIRNYDDAGLTMHRERRVGMNATKGWLEVHSTSQLTVPTLTALPGWSATMGLLPFDSFSPSAAVKAYWGKFEGVPTIGDLGTYSAVFVAAPN